MTVETALCVLLPFSFRQLCTRRTTMSVLVGSVLFSTLLHAAFFYTHSVKPTLAVRWPDGGQQELQRRLPPRCWYVSLSYALQGDAKPLHALLEKVYYWAQTMVSIVLPTTAMLVCSVLIVTKFTFKAKPSAFN